MLHRDIQDRSALALTVGKNGPKLKVAADDETESATRRGNIRTFRKMTMAGLVNFLANIATMPVLDATGLTGLYNFTLDLTPSPGDSSAQDGTRTAADPAGVLSRLFAAVEDQLGLKLESKRIRVEQLVIDSVEHPSPN